MRESASGLLTRLSTDLTSVVGGEASSRVDEGDQSLPVRDPNRGGGLFGGGHKPKGDVLNGRGQLRCCVSAVQDEHHFGAATCNPEVDRGPWSPAPTRRGCSQNALTPGSAFKANPLVETGVVDGADSRAKLGAEGG